MLMVLVIAGMFFSANAQVNMCKITGGVEAKSIVCGSASDEIVVTLTNTNSYKVTVNMDVVVVDTEGNETPRQKTVVISANKEKEVIFRTKAIKGETKPSNARQSYVSSLHVEMCE